jgi:integrase
MCLHQAMVWDLLTRNVASLVSPPAPKPKQMHVWSTQEAQAFLKSTTCDPLHPLYAVALSLGLRKGELLGLRWLDINFDTCTLSVNGQLLPHVMGAPRKRGSTKNSRNRTLDMPRSLVSTLQSHRGREIEKSALQNQEWSFDRYVFTNSHGRPLDHNKVITQLALASQKAGVRVLTVHELRHTCASLLFSKGIPIITISKILGHANPTITANLYTHLFQQSFTEAATAMNDLLG